MGNDVGPGRHAVLRAKIQMLELTEFPQMNHYGVVKRVFGKAAE
jgi:hypothetical protein